MPECLDCQRSGATAEFRRTTRGGVPGFICMDKPRCKLTVSRVKAAKRAENLLPAERKLIEDALAKLARLRTKLGPAFEAPTLHLVSTAHENLAVFVDRTFDRKGD